MDAWDKTWDDQVGHHSKSLTRSSNPGSPLILYNVKILKIKSLL